MKRLLLVFALLFMAAPIVASKHVAVLETISEKGVIGRSEKMFLTDKLRERAKAVLPAYMGYVVMTRENINVMLPPGKSIEDCEGSCLVETGKNIAADYVAQARVGKFGKQFTLTMELYETAGNNLVGSFTARRPDAEGLLDEIEREADRVFLLIMGSNAPAVAGNEGISGVSTGSGGYRASALKSNIVRDESMPIGDKGYTLVDMRDGNKYNTVKIGNQTWMAENLNYKMQDSYCYENKESNCSKYGRLYEWKAAAVACPSGWHLPNRAEFETLFESFGGKKVAGKGMKSRSGWYNYGADIYGFNALPAGLKYKDGKSRSLAGLLGGGGNNRAFSSEGGYAYFWGAADSINVLYCTISNSDDASLRNDDYGDAYSVRCLKD